MSYGSARGTGGKFKETEGAEDEAEDAAEEEENDDDDDEEEDDAEDDEDAEESNVEEEDIFNLLFGCAGGDDGRTRERGAFEETTLRNSRISFCCSFRFASQSRSISRREV